MSFIHKKIESEIAYLTIDKETSLNALNHQVIQELSSELDAMMELQEVRVLVITGAGKKAFVAGADIKEFSDFEVSQGTKLAAEGQKKTVQ